MKESRDINVSNFCREVAKHIKYTFCGHKTSSANRHPTMIRLLVPLSFILFNC